MRTSRKADFCLKKDFRSSKNNFRRHDIPQGLDRESPSLSHHFVLLDVSKLNHRGKFGKATVSSVYSFSRDAFSSNQKKAGI